MNANAILTCFGYNGLSTGAMLSLEGMYSFNSGNTAVIWNQIYPTGSNYQNGQVYGPAMPLVAMNTMPVNGAFTGGNPFKVGYQHTGDFSVLLDIQYSPALKTRGKDAVLLSTVEDVTSLSSGFYIGINDVGRLMFLTNGYQKTLSKELSDHDFVHVALTNNQFVEFGIYSIRKNTYYSASVRMPSGALKTNNLYIGGTPILTKTNNSTASPYYSTINQMFLWNDARSSDDLAICTDCALVTGYTTGSQVYSWTGMQITGNQFSGVSASTTTGTSYVTSTVTRQDGATVSILYPSGMTGVVTTGEIATPLLGSVQLSVSRTTYSFLYNTSYVNSFGGYSVEFDQTLTSGDVVELYYYPRYNGSVGIPVNGFDVPSGGFQLYDNGLAETSGVDYQVLHNEFSGYSSDLDILQYDAITGNSIVLPYSGYWQNSRVATGNNVYFPAAPQYYENTGAGQSGLVFITNLSGICTNNPSYPNLGYDIYINGQKLVSGIQYSVSGSGVNTMVVVLSSANLPSFFGTPIGSNAGYPTGVINLDVPEMTFVPQFSGFKASILNITGNQKTITNLTGFSEQVWVNGLRQLKGLDYLRHNANDTITGIFDPPTLPMSLYSSETDTIGLWNYAYPPQYTFAFVGNDTNGLLTFAGNPSTALPWDDGNFLEMWGSATIAPSYPSAPSDSFAMQLEDIQSSNFIAKNPIFNDIYYGYNYRTTRKFRYRNGNIIGKWSNQITTAILYSGPSLNTPDTAHFDGTYFHFSAQVAGSYFTDTYYVHAFVSSDDDISGQDLYLYPDINGFITVAFSEYIPSAQSVYLSMEFIDGTYAITSPSSDYIFGMADYM